MKLQIERLRTLLITKMSSETSFNKQGNHPTSGHCALIAVLLKMLLNLKIVSVYVDNISHWFNVININGQIFYIDLTNQQFGLDEVLYQENELPKNYLNLRERDIGEINLETFQRFITFSNKLDSPIYDLITKLKEELSLSK